MALNPISNVLKYISQNWGFVMIPTLLQLRKQRHRETKNRGPARSKRELQSWIGTQFVSLHSATNKDNVVTSLWSKVICRKSSALSLCLWTQPTVHGKSLLNLAGNHHRHRLLAPWWAVSFPLVSYADSPSAVKNYVSRVCKKQRTETPMWNIIQL